MSFKVGLHGIHFKLSVVASSMFPNQACSFSALPLLHSRCTEHISRILLSVHFQSLFVPCEAAFLLSILPLREFLPVVVVIDRLLRSQTPLSSPPHGRSSPQASFSVQWARRSATSTGSSSHRTLSVQSCVYVLTCKKVVCVMRVYVAKWACWRWICVELCQSIGIGNMFHVFWL